jgi:hypothetical protein
MQNEPMTVHSAWSHFSEPILAHVPQSATSNARKREREDLSDPSPRPIKVVRSLAPRNPLSTIPNPNRVGKHRCENTRDHNHRLRHVRFASDHQVRLF